jgi:mannose-6-phosphate isomerase-like protein (cupin superfamily)
MTSRALGVSEQKARFRLAGDPPVGQDIAVIPASRHARKETDMATLKDGTALYEVERRVRYAERPGFRITELQIAPTQEIPSHSHTQTQDTFYVLEQGEGARSSQLGGHNTKWLVEDFPN